MFGRRRSGPRNPPSPADASIHERMPPLGGVPRPGSSGSSAGSPNRVPPRRGSPIFADAAGPAAGRGAGSAADDSFADPRSPVVEDGRSGKGASSSGPSASASTAPLDSAAVVPSRIQPSRDRRARAWYSGPCLRGSAYSFGLIVQYVPLDAPYHVAPVQPGSKGSLSAPSYDVEPGVAVGAGPRRADDRRARPAVEPLVGPGPAPPSGRSPAGPARDPGPGGREVPDVLVEEPAPGPGPAASSGRGRALPPGRAPGVRRPSARPAARARLGSARQGSRGSAEGGSVGRSAARPPTRRIRPGPASCSYAAWIARNRGSAASPAASGWLIFASRRYARRISSWVAPGARPSVRHGSAFGAIGRSMPCAAWTRRGRPPRLRGRSDRTARRP